LALGAPLGVATPASPAAAAVPGLRIVTVTRYEVQPDRGRVHVTIDAAATALTPDTSAGHTYYSGVTFGVPREAAHVAATSAGSPLRVTHDPKSGRVGVTFGAAVFFQQTYRYRITFDLLDGGGAPDREVRVGPSLVAFPVWAYGTADTGGSSVRVTIPAGYTVTVEAGAMTDRSTASTTILVSDGIDDPTSYFAYVSADRAGAFTATPLTLSVGRQTARIEVRAWSDDPEWGKRMASLLRDGLPELHRQIGLDYPIGGTLGVEEAATSRLGEYAGTYDSFSDSITVRYDADAVVGLHEAAHIWFNGSLFRDRWIDEAFAEYYGVAAARALGLHGSTFALDPELIADRVPLNDWGAPGVEKPGVEDFAYAATYHLAQLIADRTDADGLQRVWRAASDGELSYQPVHGDGTPAKGRAITQESWQQLLDLLEERTGASYADLWKAWIVNDTQALLLEQRERARTPYQADVRDAGDWELPDSIRFLMSSWQFDEAAGELSEVRFVLSKRDRIAAAAARLDLVPPPTLRQKFEGDAGLEAARSEADAELATLSNLSKTEELSAGEPTALAWIGLLGAQPAVDLDAARDAFEAGDLAVADDRATAAFDTRATAEETGRLRVAVGGGALLALDAAAMAGLGARRRARRRRAVAPAVEPSSEWPA
ncbi:MAG TPA: hypothetical protein VFM74_05340, partial [Candidatus Limnocylindria bacterium]|nr:hypothetical protein [Candidatus Limnocylindria bacterium]